MRYIFAYLSIIFLLVLSFNGCSKEPEPYYDRANKAAQKAHDKLDKE